MVLLKYYYYTNINYININYININYINININTKYKVLINVCIS